MTCGCRHARHTGENASPPGGTHATRRWWIDLSAGPSRARVELPRLVAVRVQGVDMVPLDALWAAARLGGALAGLRFDFLADDGFRITAKQPEGIDGSELRTGYVCVRTRDLVWQPVPERPCFWRVKGVAALALLVTTAACSREGPTPAEAVKPAAVATPGVASPSASASPGGAGVFGASCVDDGECASTVCFHKRLKTAASGPERRGGGDALEHDGYCSMRCDTDADCPSPPSSGRCGARGMCKRPES